MQVFGTEYPLGVCQQAMAISRGFASFSHLQAVSEKLGHERHSMKKEGNHMQPNNHPAAPDSFENSRLEDLVMLHQAISALGQAPDYTAVVEQRSALYDRVRDLHPTLISDEEKSALNLLIGSMAATRKETLSI
ncbi:hypothetical protein PSTH1771_25950 [Pseudomonas syringae pv. theae]|uniref:hypothetical protein n=1 Tax=Pseudomonas syringae TaxID=317 RepID=UPI0023BB80F8|nr:hypothetical protein [Pseudomonas syringae]GKS08528.1 hypothetical protein PSTH1771_25950 [Pseudomonas syringae pv. theae]